MIEMMARATGLEPASSGVTGRDKSNHFNANGYFLTAPTGLKAAKVSAREVGYERAPFGRRELPITCPRTNPPVPFGRGPDSHFLSSVASVNSSVSQTEQTQPRDGMMMRRDTASWYRRASPSFLLAEELGDDQLYCVLH